MAKVAFIGAGSRGFGTSLLGDILSHPELADSTIALDPLTGAACTLDEIREMAEELFEASADYLPEYR